MVNPVSSHSHVSPWASRSASVFSLGLSNGHGASVLHEGSKRDREVIEMEYLFSKMLTPSDVGKLNHLLIPRQYAEKYFPKISEAKSDGDESILSFEDSSIGLVWHFCYSFWHSSNTKVLTKGWTTFIRVKRINAGDVVSFYRGVSESAGTNRWFIHIKPRASISSVPGISSVPHRVPSPIFTSSGLLNDNWVREGLGFGSSYGFEPAWKPLTFGSRGITPPKTPMPQPTMFPEPTSLGNDMGRVEKRVRLFGLDIDFPSRAGADEFCNVRTNDAA